LSKKLSFIESKTKSIRDILDNEKYSVDVFQREYRWEEEHIQDLIEDLTNKFLENYDDNDERKDVKNYSKYFLGPIILNLKDTTKMIIDGQQRLSSLSLLLIYLNNIQKDRDDKVFAINDLIASETYGEKSLNLQIDDRKEYMMSLIESNDFDISDQNESVKNLKNRYDNIVELFPSELTKKPLPYFIDWLMNNVVLVVIETYVYDDAYKIFETMNNRGLSLTPPEILKGHLLSQITSEKEKLELNEIWKKRISEIKNLQKKHDMVFVVSWLRGKYAESMRKKEKNATDEDFEIIATHPHTWIKDNEDKIGLGEKISFYDFIKKHFNFYAKQFMRIYDATQNYTKELEHVFYVARWLAPSLYFPLILSTLNLDDDDSTITKKIQLVAQYLEIFVVIKKINGHSVTHSYLNYALYNLTKEIRNATIDKIKKILKKSIKNQVDTLDAIYEYALEKHNKNFVKYLLARITTHIEEKSEFPNTSYEKYVTREKKE